LLSMWHRMKFCQGGSERRFLNPSHNGIGTKASSEINRHQLFLRSKLKNFVEKIGDSIRKILVRVLRLLSSHLTFGWAELANAALRLKESKK
jgi:hypothetical protein